jgi:hypothetical protein
MSNSKTKEKIEKALKISKAKELMTVNVIQHNKVFDKLRNQLKDALIVANTDNEKFINQRELYMRNKMLERTLASCLRLVEQNRLQFYMIDENTLNIEEDK